MQSLPVARARMATESTALVGLQWVTRYSINYAALLFTEFFIKLAHVQLPIFFKAVPLALRQLHGCPCACELTLKDADKLDMYQIMTKHNKSKPHCLILSTIFGVDCLINPADAHWGRDKMDAIWQTTFSNEFSWMKIYEFRLKFHWSLFLRVQWTISQHWFR